MKKIQSSNKSLFLRSNIAAALLATIKNNDGRLFLTQVVEPVGRRDDVFDVTDARGFVKHNAATELLEGLFDRVGLENTKDNNVDRGRADGNISLDICYNLADYVDDDEDDEAATTLEDKMDRVAGFLVAFGESRTRAALAAIVNAGNNVAAEWEAATV